MLEPKSVTVNGRSYTVNPFNPIVAYEFHHAHVNSIAYGKSLFGLGMKVLRQCIDDKGRDISVDENFQAVFSEHPEDLIPLEKAAKEALMSPFETQSESTS